MGLLKLLLYQDVRPHSATNSRQSQGIPVNTPTTIRNRLLLATLLALLPASNAWAARPAQLTSEHFLISYDPAHLTEADARRAMGEAERGYEHCLSVFGKEPSGRIECDLTPRFLGATGFASPEAR